MNSDIFIVGGARTPMGEYTGRLKDLSALDLGAIASKAAMERTAVSPEAVDHVAAAELIPADEVRRVEVGDDQQLHGFRNTAAFAR